MLVQQLGGQHGHEVEEQVRLLLKLARQRLLEGRLKQVRCRAWYPIPAEPGNLNVVGEAPAQLCLPLTGKLPAGPATQHKL